MKYSGPIRFWHILKGKYAFSLIVSDKLCSNNNYYYVETSSAGTNVCDCLLGEKKKVNNNRGKVN